MKLPLDRRSFLAQVIGAATLGGCATTRAQGRAPVQPQTMAVDADPSDPARAIPAQTTGTCSDSDSGPQADPANRGRRCGSRLRSGITDSDSGPDADPTGQGRGRGQGQGPEPRSYIVCPGHRRCPR